MLQGLKIRPVILAVSVAAIAASGAWYGADLKTQQQVKKVNCPCLSQKAISLLAPSPLPTGVISILTIHLMIQEVITRREATSAEKIASLEQTKAGLLSKKAGLEKKIVELQARRAGQVKTKNSGRLFGER